MVNQKISLPTSGGTYNIYSTFQNKGIQATVEDALGKHLHLVTHLVIM
jgi:hypothetical protein